jgi:nitrate reductase NapE component
MRSVYDAPFLESIFNKGGDIVFSAENERQFYSWSQIWESEDKEKAVELELALYKMKIDARISESKGLWIVRVPWIYKHLAIEVTDAYDKDMLDYPHEIEVNHKWKSYQRFEKPTSRARGSKTFLVLGFVVFLLLFVRIIFATGFFK